MPVLQKIKKTAMTSEEWRAIPGYEGIYEVSSFGRVRSLDRHVRGKHDNLAFIRGKLLRPFPGAGGHLRVNLCDEYGRFAMFVHRLVALVFIPNPDNLPDVAHRDMDLSNNRAENLFWGSEKDIANHGTRNETLRRVLAGKKKNLTEEGRQRIAEAKGKPIIGTNCETQETVCFPSMAGAEAAGFSSVGISHCITNRQKTHRGYTWRLANNELSS